MFIVFDKQLYSFLVGEKINGQVAYIQQIKLKMI